VPVVVVVDLPPQFLGPLRDGGHGVPRCNRQPAGGPLFAGGIVPAARSFCKRRRRSRPMLNRPKAITPVTSITRKRQPSLRSICRNAEGGTSCPASWALPSSHGNSATASVVRTKSRQKSSRIG